MCEPLKVGVDNVMCTNLYSNALENGYTVHTQIRYCHERTPTVYIIAHTLQHLSRDHRAVRNTMIYCYERSSRGRRHGLDPMRGECEELQDKMEGKF